MPLPLDFRTRDMARRLVVTLAYFSPCCFNRREYRHADLWVEFPEEGEALYRLGLKPLYTDTRLARRGTLQHQVYEGRGISNWDEDAGVLAIQVHCANRAGLPSLGKTTVRYALMVTFEVMAGTDVYDPIVQRIREPVLVAPNATI